MPAGARTKKPRMPCCPVGRRLNPDYIAACTTCKSSEAVFCQAEHSLDCLQINRKELPARHIVQLRRQHLAGGGNFQRAEELITFAWRPITLHPLGNTQELELRTEGGVELAGAKGPGVRRSRNKLPKRRELGKLGGS